MSSSVVSNSRRDFFDGFVGHVETTEGVGDLFSLIQETLSHLRAARFLSQNQTSFVDRLDGATQILGVALSIPAFISDTNELRHRCVDLWEAEGQGKGRGAACKDCFLEAIDWCGTAAETIFSLAAAECILLTASQLYLLSFVYYGTSLLFDGMDLGEDISCLSKGLQGDEKRLRCLCVAKNVASLAISLLALRKIIFTEGTCGDAVVPLLATTWLVTKVAGEVYKKMINVN